jgi:hypothetical protein
LINVPAIGFNVRNTYNVVWLSSLKEGVEATAQEQSRKKDSRDEFRTTHGEVELFVHILEVFHEFPLRKSAQPTSSCVRLPREQLIVGCVRVGTSSQRTISAPDSPDVPREVDRVYI